MGGGSNLVMDLVGLILPTLSGLPDQEELYVQKYCLSLETNYGWFGNIWKAFIPKKGLLDYSVICYQEGYF